MKKKAKYAKKTTMTALIRARTTPELKGEVHAIFAELGITPSQALNIFYSEVRRHRGLPFEVKVPRIYFENWGYDKG